MKIFIWIVLIVFCFAVLGYAQSPGIAEPEGAKMQFKKTSHDFGEMEDGTIVDYVFNFTNVGDEILRIQRVKGS